MEINKEKFLAALDQLEKYQNNTVNNSLEKKKAALEEIIRKVECLLRESNSEFEEYLINSGINFEDIFDEIQEFNSPQEVDKKEQEIFSNFFNFYYFSLVGEEITSIREREKVEALISILETFGERKILPLSTIYQENEEKIEDIIETFKAINLSLDEPEKTEKVIPGSSKGKGKEPEKNLFLTDEVLKKMNKDNIIELQKKVIEEKEEEIEKLEKELEAEREKNQQLKLELEKLQGEELETKTEFLPKYNI